MRNKLLTIVCAFILSCSSAEKEDQQSKNNLQAILQTADTTSAIQPSLQYANKASFKLLNLFDGKIQFDIPERLLPMDSKMFELKYPYENQGVTIAYSDEDATVSLLISPRQDKATQTDLPKYQQMMNDGFDDNPSIDFRKSEIKKINGRDFIVIEMITPAVDTRVYNLMFITTFEGKLLIGTFNCTIEKMKEWQPVARQILNSMKVRD